MQLKRLCEIERVRGHYVNDFTDHLAVTPNNIDISCHDMLGSPYHFRKALYIWVWNEHQDIVKKGVLSVCYSTWFIIHTVPINEIESMDFLYVLDHKLYQEDSIGILYEATNNEQDAMETG